MSDPLECHACGQPIAEDQTIVRISMGAMSYGGFGHLLLLPDIYLHAGWESAGPWGDEPSPERWCATPEALAAALVAASHPIGAHATSGGSAPGAYGGQ